ncbi:hypothetical protein FVE85_7435 [Porphyridium purpureum]|uniref:AMP-activated protein kinase glycogen-binding domain-containing protein n=1 Tax=Porphyridium purpureum TaxID=35688 RepID=A0A5J4Z9P8_PORPP|nr:hypothetical protein FVE85_7435 [Porphyridium purpureum]|eukprot:POR1331..scf295_1
MARSRIGSEMSLVDVDVAECDSVFGAAAEPGSSGTAMRSAAVRANIRRAKNVHAYQHGEHGEHAEYGSSSALSGLLSRAGSSTAPVATHRKESPQPQPPKAALTYVEFVYYARGEMPQSVEILGDWNGWEAVPLHDAGKRLWRVVVLLPAGYHEFVYCVNGELRLSEVHPKTSDGRSNWRHVVGTSRARNHLPNQGRLFLSKGMIDVIEYVSRSLARSASVASLVGSGGAAGDELSEMSSVTSSETDEEGQEPSYFLEKTRSLGQPLSRATSTLGVSFNCKTLYAGILFFLVIYFVMYATLSQSSQ